MGFIIQLLISGLAVFITSYVLPGVHVDGFITALLVAVVLGIANAVIKPILFILTLPITILTLGLFALILNALIILLVGTIIPGFQVDGLLWAIVFGVVLSVVNAILHRLIS